MNKKIARPLIIQFTPQETNPALKRSSKSLFVPVNTPWVQFRDNVLPMVADTQYDSVLVHVTNEVDRDIKGVVGNMSIKMNALAGVGTKVGKPVLSYESPDEPFYLANPEKTDMKASEVYAPSDETIMAKYNSFESNDDWQEYQSKIWGRMKDMMPLSKKADQFNRDHAAQLKDPKRGLEDKDLEKFWSFKSRQGLSPTIMGDDMVGMPSVEGREYEGFTMSINQPGGGVETKSIQVRSLMTVGASGIAIPMANANGHVSKHQIAADLTPFGTVLHFRAADGKTVTKGELYDKKTREYSFNFADGNPTHLKVTAVAQDNTITMQDTHGIFNVQQKKELVDVLKERGYDVPEIIVSVKAEQNGKYMWQSPGTMTGSDEVLKTVSPSNPGFINARDPKNGEDKYVVLVAEGALKGHIVAKYIDVKDKDGECFGDKIAGNKGIIVTQVPGVAEAYVKNAVTIYDKYPVAGTYIAMDADGRENRNVAMGIHTAYNYISKVSPTTVLSWDPAQKGMDDALLAVAQGKITIKEMGIVSGKPEKLFPIENAKQMTPYRLDGTQTSKPSWMQEYEEDKKARQEKVAAAQAATTERQEQRESKEGQWVATPKDISSIRNITVTKAADMADAMAGKIPPAKAEPKVTHTPDVDESMAETPDKKDEPDLTPPVETRMTKELKGIAQKWDSENLAMPPISVPDGYVSSYNYRQFILPEPLATRNVPDNMQLMQLGYDSHGKSYGVIGIETDHEMAADEMKRNQKMLDDVELTCMGDMKLVSQSFTLNKEMMMQLTADDLPVENIDSSYGV